MSLTVKRAALKWVKKNELLVTVNDEYGNFHSISIRIDGMKSDVKEKEEGHQLASENDEGIIDDVIQEGDEE